MARLLQALCQGPRPAEEHADHRPAHSTGTSTLGGQLREKSLKSFLGSLQPLGDEHARPKASDALVLAAREEGGCPSSSTLSPPPISHLGWAAATAANSLFHMGRPKMVLCLRPVTVSVAVSKRRATLLAWAEPGR